MDISFYVHVLQDHCILPKKLIILIKNVLDITTYIEKRIYIFFTVLQGSGDVFVEAVKCGEMDVAFHVLKNLLVFFGATRAGHNTLYTLAGHLWETVLSPCAGLPADLTNYIMQVCKSGFRKRTYFLFF